MREGTVRYPMRRSCGAAALARAFDVSVRRPVQRDCTVPFEGRHYPVPFPWVGLKVEVGGCAGKVQIFHGEQLLREYPRHTRERVLAPPPLARPGTGASTHP